LRAIARFGRLAVAISKLSKDGLAMRLGKPDTARVSKPA